MVVRYGRLMTPTVSPVDHSDSSSREQQQSASSYLDDESSLHILTYMYLRQEIETWTTLVKILYQRFNVRLDSSSHFPENVIFHTNWNKPVTTRIPHIILNKA